MLEKKEHEKLLNLSFLPVALVALIIQHAA